MESTHIKSLNKDQQEAATYTEGASLILAGAGSGKTRVLIAKVNHLIEVCHMNPMAILMITFTNKAAGEMKERMGHTHIGFVGTFHSFCARILRIHGSRIDLAPHYVIFDTADQTVLMKNILKPMNTKLTPSYVLNRISQAKNEAIGAAQFGTIFQDYHAPLVAEAYRQYEIELHKHDAIDFDDLLLKTIQLLAAHKDILDTYQSKYEHVLIDEFQDTNAVQYRLARMLCASHNHVTVVGDFSQSIYSWRGADIRNLERFEADFPDTKIFHLEQNYRSTAPILEYAYKVINENTTHPILKLHTTRDGENVRVFDASDEQEEVDFIIDTLTTHVKRNEHESFAILYRTNAQSRTIEEGLLHAGFSYVLVGGTRFYERREVKDVISYLRLLLHPNDTVSRDRILKLGKRRFDTFKKRYAEIVAQVETSTTLDLLEAIFEASSYLDMFNRDDPEDYARLENIRELKSVANTFTKLPDFLEQVALVQSEYSQDEIEKKQVADIKLMTLHQAKGLEFDCVFVIGLEEGLLPHSRSLEDKYALEEERRLFYVGVTRARHMLYITHARRRFIFGRRTFGIPSRFLPEEIN